MTNQITFASLLNLYREAGLPLVSNLSRSRYSKGDGTMAGATYFHGKKVEVHKSKGVIKDGWLRETLIHEFVHHLQYDGDRVAPYLPVSAARDLTPSTRAEVDFVAYWTRPIEQEARYYENHPKEFDLLVQKHGYSALQWEEVVSEPISLALPPSKQSKLSWLAAAFAVVTLVVGVTAYSQGAKIARLETQLQQSQKENSVLLRSLDKYDPCTIEDSLDEAMDCN